MTETDRNIEAGSTRRDEASLGPPAPRRFAVSLLGSFSLVHFGEPVTIKSRKAQAIIAYLLLNASVRETRERLTGLLWSESTEEKARASLRQTVHAIRELFLELGFGGFHVTRHEIGITAPEFVIDAASVVEAAGRGEAHPLLVQRQRLPEALLYGFEDLDPAFRVWLLVQRQALQQHLEQQLEAALRASDDALASVKPLATALLNLDPTHEEACRKLMLAYAESGDVAGALRTYKSLWDVLDREYDSEPSSATQELVVKIKNNEIACRAPVPAPSDRPPVRPSDAAHSARQPEVAPLPQPQNVIHVHGFDGAGIGDDFDHLTHGLRYELVTALTRFRDWTIVDADPAGEGAASRRRQRSDNRYFSVRVEFGRAADSLTISVSLASEPGARLIWIHTYRLSLERWFDIQEAVIRRIAVALDVQCSTARLAATARRPDITLSAHDRWLRADKLLLNWSASDWARAEQILLSIVEEAPRFTPAYTGLVRMKNSEHLVFPGRVRTHQRACEALRLAKQGIQADPYDSRVHLALAWSFAMLHQFEQAELGFELALKLNRNDSWTLTSSALGLAFCARHRDALALADEALSIDPDPLASYWAYQAVIRFLCEDYVRSIDAAARSRAVISNVPAWEAAALVRLGNADEAERKVRLFLSRTRAKWHGAEPATDAAICRWLLGCFPIREVADWERLRGCLRAAKAPVPEDHASHILPYMHSATE